MREIEFRAWLRNEKRMVNIQDLILNGTGVVGFQESNKNPITDGGYHFIMFELMQYTGLKDKNGKKIFEGDIVRTYRLNADKYLEDRTREYDEFIGVITWNEVYLEYYIQKNSNEYEDVLKPFELHYEVIGNIYENKELLEE